MSVFDSSRSSATVIPLLGGADIAVSVHVEIAACANFKGGWLSARNERLIFQYRRHCDFLGTSNGQKDSATLHFRRLLGSGCAFL